MNYDFKKKRYASVRMNKGGGSREVRFELGAGKEDILQARIDIFFTDGNSSLGRAGDFLFQLGNYSCEEIGEEIDGKKFSLGRYQDKYKLSRIRMYLMTKKKIGFRKWKAIVVTIPMKTTFNRHSSCVRIVTIKKANPVQLFHSVKVPAPLLHRAQH